MREQISLKSKEKAEHPRVLSLRAVRVPEFATFLVTIILVFSPATLAAALSEPELPAGALSSASLSDPQASSQTIPSTTGSRPALQATPNPTNFFGRWQARATRIQSSQPRWIVPVVAAYPMLIQVFRADFTRQVSSTGVRTWNLDANRGLNLIPFNRTEFDVLLPPYLEHGDKTLDGFGDMSFQAKYRILSANEKRGNYMLSTQLVGVLPTGSHKNGSTDASINPTVNGGKGWGRFDFITNLGATLPTGKTASIGRTLTTATVAQYHVGKYLFPELEINTTRWYGSTRDGKIQTFLTPGIAVGKYAFHPHDPRARSGFVGGVAFQVAATTYHVYNHSLVFTGRYIF